ncbi:MAG: sulfatase [Chitinophagaceae bacterium]|nr:sulfatase [Chitinophagaceae bacterium]
MAFRILFTIVTIILLSGCRNAKDTRPNIVFVLVDDMRWDEYGAFGHSFIKTPNIDRLAREGVRFTNAFASTPLCSPSRAAFLTGLYGHSNGITDNTARNEQSHRLETFPKKLNEAGYETAFIGKWHMGNDDSKRPGFDYWVSMKGQGEATDPLLNINGRRDTVKGYVTDILTGHALQFINRSREKPFVLYLAHKALHPNILQRDDGKTINIGEGGFVAADRHKGMYGQSPIQRQPNYAVPPSDKPALARKIAGLPPLGKETVTRDEIIRQRSEMLMAVDEGLGSILKALEQKGILDNTVIIFTSDHGYWYGEHGLSEERRLAYEESIRIPLLIRYPKLMKGNAKEEHAVMNIDLAPTLLQMAGVTTPGNLHGRSLLPLFNRTAIQWRNSIMVEYYSDSVFPRMDKMGYKAVRNERYKYIHYVDLKGVDELYDLQQDPYELENVINKPGMDAVLQEMKNELNKLLKETGDVPLVLTR